MRNLIAVLAVLALSTGCAAKKIPGTEVDDTDDTRAILAVMDAYRHAYERRDAQGIYELADPTFKDDGGSADPGDDLEYSTLTTRLPEKFKHVDELKLEINVRKIEFEKDPVFARSTYNYTLSFKMPQHNNKTQSEGDIKQMHFKRVGDKQWKIVSGI